jgi:hypothetical protein
VRRTTGIVLTALLMLTGCSLDSENPARSVDQVEPDAASPDAGADGDVRPETLCESNRDCAGGEVCRAGVCRTACSVDDPCTGDLSICDDVLEYCVECLIDNDCGTNTVCEESECVFHCVEDSACGPDEYCRRETGACETRECESDDDCSGGFRCQEYVCVSIDEIVCDAGTATCDDTDAVLRCNEDGTATRRTECGDDAVCVVADDDASCLDLVCEPHEVGCEDPENAYVCNASGTERTRLPCGDRRYCLNGVCRAEICEPSSQMCDGVSVVQCDDLGASQQVRSCIDGCAAEHGCGCGSGECFDRVCLPGSARCVGNAAQRCQDQGAAYDDPVACGVDEVCIRGACLTETCDPASTVCAIDVLLTCDRDGTEWNEFDCIGQEQICVFEDGRATCQERVCAPDEQRCADGDEVVLVCDARGATERRSACRIGTFCSEGACLDRVCDSNDPPTCVDGDVARCNQRGSAFVIVDDCADDQRCREGACVPLACEPGTVTCSGETLLTCSDDGLELTRRNCIEERAFCDGEQSACVQWVCEPGADNECVAGDVQRCDDRGRRHELVQGCDDGDPCTDDSCSQARCNYRSLEGLHCTPDGDACTTDVCVDGACVHRRRSGGRLLPDLGPVVDVELGLNSRVVLVGTAQQGVWVGFLDPTAAGLVATTIDNDGDGDVTARAAVAHSDGGVTVLSQVNVGRATSGWLVHTDPEGAPQWSSRILADTSVHDLVGDGVGGTVVAGIIQDNDDVNSRDGFAGGFDAEGAETWSTDFGSQLKDGAYAITKSPGVGYAIGGSTMFPERFWLTRLDLDGGYLAAHDYRYSDVSRDTGRAITTTQNGDYVLVGSACDDDCLSQGVWIVRIGPDGDVVWGERISGDAVDLGRAVASDSGRILVGGRVDAANANVLGTPWAAMLDQDGELLWEWTRPGPELGSVEAVGFLPNGEGVLVAGLVGTQGFWQIVDGTDGTACEPQVCDPNTTYCDGNRAVTCNALGTGPVDDGVNCGGGVCTNGECAPPCSSLHFANDTHVRVPNSDDFVFGEQSVTIEAWTWFDPDRPVGHNLIVGSHDLDCEGAPIPSWSLTGHPGADSVLFADIPTCRNTGTRLLSDRPTRGEWHHVAFVRSGVQWRLYVDGLVTASLERAGPIVDTGADLFIGDGEDQRRHWEGYIDSVRISGAALYDEEFVPERRLGVTDSTLALWNFDAGEGDLAYDASGRGNHGTIVGAAWDAADPLCE